MTSSATGKRDDNNDHDDLDMDAAFDHIFARDDGDDGDVGFDTGDAGFGGVDVGFDSGSDF